jgi:MinD superfamily P-loop ATPase
MKELTIISGKGGTGKTSITAAFSMLAESSVTADCDVDAADLFLLMHPQKREKENFQSGNEAIISEKDCINCGKCEELCRFDAIVALERRREVNPMNCEGCGVCVHFCPVKAIDFPKRTCGEIYISDTDYGTLVHAKLAVGGENSGKLVAYVRVKSKQIAERENAELILTDGPPGIGCPVIASITGTDAVIIVTEPTLSAQHDLDRIVALSKHFETPYYVIVNKWDINRKITAEISSKCKHDSLLGYISYDMEFTNAQLVGKSVMEYKKGIAYKEINDIWQKLKERI